MKLTVKAPAKINLFLDITARRENGYHDIKSIMQSVSLFDILTFEENDVFSLSCTDTSLPCDNTNLVWRAADAFFDTADGKERNIKITIEKNIPMAAGLAGGSADCAATLAGLNELYGSQLTDNELCDIGAKLGADVPFCIKCGTYVTEGIGEVMTKAPAMPGCILVVAKDPLDGVSTPAAYKALDELYGNFKKRSPYSGFESIYSALEKNDIRAIADSLYNIFEDVILPSHPSVTKIKQTMANAGALTAIMSGSGPSVFGIFDSEEKAKKACEKLKKDGIFAAVCYPIEKR